MSDQLDHLDQMLQSLDPTHAAIPPAPPSAFLHAVGRRRRRRIASRAAASCLGVSFILGVVYLFLPATPLTPPVPAIPSHNTFIARTTLPDTAALALTRANLDVSPERLLLPDRPSGPVDPPLRVGLRRDPAEIEQWIGQ